MIGFAIGLLVGCLVGFIVGLVIGCACTIAVRGDQTIKQREQDDGR